MSNLESKNEFKEPFIQMAIIQELDDGTQQLLLPIIPDEMGNYPEITIQDLLEVQKHYLSELEGDPDLENLDPSRPVVFSIEE